MLSRHCTMLREHRVSGAFAYSHVAMAGILLIGGRAIIEDNMRGDLRNEQTLKTPTHPPSPYHRP